MSLTSFAALDRLDPTIPMRGLDSPRSVLTSGWPSVPLWKRVEGTPTFAASPAAAARSERPVTMVMHGRIENPVIGPELQRELWKHPGKWAAIKDDHLIAVGSTPGQALRRAERKGIPDVMLHRVPENGDRVYIL